MNIMNQLTKKHMRSNKKRTIMTILGVIISVAMITAVSTATTTFMNYLQRFEMDHNGNWHVQYQNLPKNQTNILEAEDTIANVFYTNNLGYGKFVDIEAKNQYKPFLYLEEYTSEAMEEMNLKLIEGHFPENESQLVIPENLSIKDGKKLQIGDTITVEVGERYVGEYTPENLLNQTISYDPETSEEKFMVEDTKTYEIVGVISRPNFEYYSAPGYTCITYLDMDALTDSDHVTASVFENKVTKKIYEKANQFADQLGLTEDDVDFNNDVLSYYGVSQYDGFNVMIQSLQMILILIIMVGSISLIYNSFAISITERSKQFGMLSSVGATKQQKRNAVFYEGAVIGSIAIPFGILSGILGMGITFRIVEPMLNDSFGIGIPLRLYVSTQSILIAVIFSVLTIFVSAYIPARRASRISAMEAIRQTNDIKLAKKAVKTNRITRKIFGLEGDLALKNLKRNKKRFRALVFSLFISLVLFISVSSYVYYVTDAFKMANEGANYDVYVRFNEGNESDTMLEVLKQVEGVTSGARVTKYNLDAAIDETYLDTHIMNQVVDARIALYKGWGWSEKEAIEAAKGYQNSYWLEFIVLDDATYQQYVSQLGMNEDVKTSAPISGILVNKHKDQSGYSIVETEILDAKSGDELPVYFQLYNSAVDEEGNNSHITGDKIESYVELLAVTNELPMGLSYASIIGSMNLIVTDEMMNKILELAPETSNVYSDTRYLFTIDQPEGLDERIEATIKAQGNDSFYIFNRFEQEKQNKQLVAVMSIFAYGFITLISLICVANLCNTIATSFALRRREFAMLKSVGMTPKSFRRMIYFESFFYGFKALLYGLPVSVFITYQIYKVVNNNFMTGFTFPWMTYVIGVVSVILVVGIAMTYSTVKIKDESIIDGLKSEIN